jgi:putative tryptophan/tyrosine transport system substrate-binding protein
MAMSSTIGGGHHDQRHARVDGRKASVVRRHPLGLIGMLIACCLWTPLASDAQQAGKIPRVGVLTTVLAPTTKLFYEVFRQGLQELGYVEGQNIALEYRSAEGRYEQLPALAAELVGLPVAVIVTWGTPAALAAQRATTMIPVVFTAVADPLLSGLVRGFAQPGGNITGVTHIPSELDTKRLQLLKEAVPNASHVAVLWNPEFPPNVEGLNELKMAAQALRVELHLVAYRGPDDFEGAVAAMRQDGAEALFVMPHPTASGHATRLAALAGTHRLPAMAPYREFAEAGGLLAYGGMFSEMYRRVPIFVDKILKGAKPSELPIERPMRFDFVINLKTAKALGITIPPPILIQATEVLE